MTLVTQPLLPPLEEFNEYLKEIWDKKWLTNNGQFHKQLEKELCAYLGVKYISVFTNGTIALITALQHLGITGEVITTPYSFVATTHSLWWNNIKPVFVDVDPVYLNLDPEKIEAAITPLTTAIMPVHVYGNPCAVEAIDAIAKKHGLKVLYDAAHAFNTKLNNESILNFGDLSILSFHATKVFNTIEGGAIVSHDAATKEKIDKLKNFGFEDEVTVSEIGINGKMNEVQAAFGLLQLKYIDRAIESRKVINDLYDKTLSTVPGITVIRKNPHAEIAYPYFAILIDSQIYGKSRDEVYEALKKYDIFSRRYFFPVISEFPMYRDLPSAQRENLPIAFKSSMEVLCLPIYPELEIKEAERIVSLIKTRFAEK